MAEYDFGPDHPLRPERLRRAVRLLEAENLVSPIAPEPATEDDLLRVHSSDYIAAVKRASGGSHDFSYGIGTSDNPPFPNMHEKSLWYVGGSVAAAKAVVNGAPFAINLSGGLHHALRSSASGFCVYNDPAIMISILREKFERVAYIDIDVHHGDGVQWIYYNDFNVLTISIHESGETIFPGTGFTSEVGEPKPHCINIPLEAKTTGDVWLWAFQTIVPPAIRMFSPRAVVLQMGADAHFEDQLGHLQVTGQEWLEAVRLVRNLGLPIAACGGGGYNLTTVPRMWAAASMLLAGIEPPEVVPENVAREFGFFYYKDVAMPSPRNQGLMYAQKVVSDLQQRFNLTGEC